MIARIARDDPFLEIDFSLAILRSLRQRFRNQCERPNHIFWRMRAFHAVRDFTDVIKLI